MKHIAFKIIWVIIAFSVFSCKEDSLEKQREDELKRLTEYMRTNYPEKQRNSSGLYYFVLEEGTGDSINIGDEVLFYYTLKDLDGEIKIETSGYSNGYRLNPVRVTVLPPTQLSSSASIPRNMLSVHEALTYMKRGTKARLIFDSALGFGQYGLSTYGISGFSSLIMELEVYKVYPAPTQ